MKKKFFKFFFILFTVTQCISQVDNGRLIYTVDADAFAKRIRAKKRSEGINRKSTFELIAKEMHRIQMVLDFNQTYSKFYRKPGLTLDGSKRILNLAIAFADRGIFYTNPKTNKVLLHREFQGDDIFVDSSPKNVTWNLTKQEKEILDYTCYLATSSIETPAGIFSIKAWYAPSIPLSYGPWDYGSNLPGLILELHTNEVSFIAEKLTVNVKRGISINWPNNDQSITKNEYIQMSENLKRKLNKKN